MWGRETKMCGIAGIYNFISGKNVQPDILKKMCDIIAHRGPDDDGYFVKSNIGLGMRRLSIIDLEGGRQPMSNEDETIYVICNGEIYNYKELMLELKKLEHKFKTNSDTEVLLHAYEQWGCDFLQKLNGMYAFAIFNIKNGELFIARDRLGIKPLYYSITDKGIVFCSEIKGIITVPDIERKMDNQSIFDYFSYGYIPGERTAFEGINQLLPGHYLKVSDRKVLVKKYWDVEIKSDNNHGENYYTEKILKYLRKAVKRCLVADVPIGLFLSSGIDSTTLLALIKEQEDIQSFSTFSIGYRESSYDELPDAGKTAEFYRTRHNKLYCIPEHLPEIFDKLVWHCDNLLGDFGHILNFKMQEMASKKNKAAMIGAGGDELFVGYITYQADKMLGLYRMLPKFIRRNLIPFIVNMIPTSFEKMSFDFKTKHFLERAELDPAKAHYSWKTVFSDKEKEKLFMLKGMDDSFRIFNSYFESAKSASVFDRYLYGDLKTWLPQQLYFTDAVSMASSIENRLPYLDHELVELAFSIPFSVRMKGMKLKSIFKKAVAPLIPKEVVKRKKLGAGAPFANWIEGSLKKMMLDVLSKERVAATGLLDPKYVAIIIDQHLQHKSNNAYKIWALMTFVRWHEMYIEKFDLI